MRARLRTITTATLAFPLLSSCGPKTLALPDDPVERVAMCGAVAAASERAATTNIKAPLSFGAIGRVIHYPLVGGSAGGSFSTETAAAVQKRMTALQDKVVESKWKELVPVCKAAFPATAIEKPVLPSDSFQAQLGCSELGDFLRQALEGQEEYANELGDYRDLSDKLEPTLTAGLPASDDAAKAERNKALATMAKAGPPVAVMRQCIDRFG
ncbi:MAG TPA: hypothetical protein VFS69_06075 [Sphingomicrobium sp.]|nr:hypothetical protein [Sphingomicrobium sp.]